MSRRLDVLLDVRITRRMSVGMRTYVEQLAKRLPVVAPSLRFDTYRRGGNFGFDEQIRLPFTALSSGARVVHFLSLYTPLVMTRPFALTIHDLIHLRYPHNFKRSVAPYYGTVVRLACARALRVITDDPRTAGDLERLLGVDRRKVRVIPLGIEDSFLAESEPEHAPRPYFLYAGNHRAHKDLQTLLVAWRRLPDTALADLYLTGEDDDPSLDTSPRAGGVVRFLGNVQVAQLARLYRGANAYVHPALCEGFGLPMLEAASQGTRIIACRDAVPTVLDGLAQTFGPRDVDTLRGRMMASLDRPVSEGERDALRRSARAYTWDRCAAGTAEVYREMLTELESR